MFELPGAPALSAFRIQKLLDRLTALEPGIRALSSRFVHFIDSERALTDSEQALLRKLLTYGPRMDVAASDTGELLVVTPRAGTISPWSSKATDIVRVCGLEAVRRVERGIAYRIQTERPLGRTRLTQLAAVLFDRMTEMVLFDSTAAAQLFEHSRPKPVGSIPCDRKALVKANSELGLALSADEIEYLLTSFAR